MACFPAGTVSGAPKVRAMEIIDELEPTKRGVYAGAIMYVDFSNNLDSCIAIRTLVVRGNKGYIQAGGGIVADSVPESEYMETVNKSRALIRAIKLAQAGIRIMIVVIDNYDSFTYNLVQYLGEMGEELRVFRNDKITLEEIEALKPSHIVISPGPGAPRKPESPRKSSSAFTKPFRFSACVSATRRSVKCLAERLCVRRR